jgi:GxxExxY protein
VSAEELFAQRTQSHEGASLVGIEALASVAIDNAMRADILVEGSLLIELKSTEQHAPVHAKQVLTYLRLMRLPLGLLINFGAPTFKQGVKRLANNYYRQ